MRRREAERLPDREEARRFLTSFDWFAERPEHAAYLERHLGRLLRTLPLVAEVPAGAQVLELGASPYAMSLLVERFLDLEITPANFFGDYRDPTGGEDRVTVRSRAEGVERTFRYPLFNLELDRFPFDDASFDLVLACEILEHLALDPAHMLAEIHRVLRPGGRLVLTTPNAKRIEQVWLLLRGHNVHERYSGWGVYGRHNREYTAWELRELLRLEHFEPRVETDDGYPHPGWVRSLTAFGPLARRRDNLFAVGVKHGETVLVRPDWLYEHVQA